MLTTNSKGSWKHIEVKIIELGQLPYYGKHDEHD